MRRWRARRWRDAEGGRVTPRLRLAPGWRLRWLCELSLDERAALRELTADPALAAVLCPEQLGLGVRALDAEAAGVLARLSVTGEDAAAMGLSRRQAARLVLEGVLELVVGDAAVSGPAARAALEVPDAAVTPGSDRLAQLSEAALALACALPPDDDALAVSLWLYGYHRLPLTAEWERAFAGGSTLAWCCARCDADPTLPLARGYEVVPHPDWFAWRAAGLDEARRFAFKLYISPLPEALPEVARRALEVLAAAGVGHLKLARGLPGVLRPDKLLAYFERREDLEQVARTLARTLDGQPAHGVPFTAALTDDGLLSWGVDPQERPQMRGWRRQQSWRLWLTNRLARGLAQSRQAGLAPTEAAAHARALLWLDGVDARRWAPLDSEEEM